MEAIWLNLAYAKFKMSSQPIQMTNDTIIVRILSSTVEHDATQNIALKTCNGAQMKAEILVRLHNFSFLSNLSSRLIIFSSLIFEPL